MTNLFEQMDSKASTAGGSETTRACLSLCDIVKPVAATAEQCNKSAEDRAFELLSQESSKELSITSAAQKSAAVGVKQADACFESNYFLPSHKDAGIERMSLLAQSVNTGDGRAEPVSTQLATYGDYQMQKSAKNDSPQSIVDGIPNITGLEREVEKVTSSGDRLFAPDPHALDGVRSSFANALHMQQPMIPAGAGDLQHAPLVSNLQYMFDHINEGDNHNAPDFINCYSRMGDFITELVKDGKSPRIMLDYSGDLLWGLEQMGRTDVLDNLRKLACDPKYNHDVEFLGTMWSHAVAPSTPVPDLKLQIRAWQDHFASLFGTEALSRVRGFSPPEMALPNNPDVAYSYIKDLKDCGYRWLLVQEDTVENLDGSHVTDQHLPHMMVVRNSSGEEISMPVLIKTQGSDTKLVGQMQPLSEALTMQRQQLNGKSVPALVAQIGDGENGGVMMNEFPKIFMDKMSHLPADVPALNGTEYLERLADLGVTD